MQSPALVMVLAALDGWFQRVQTCDNVISDLAMRQMAVKGIFTQMQLVILVAGSNQNHCREISEWTKLKFPLYQAEEVRGSLNILSEICKLVSTKV